MDCIMVEYLIMPTGVVTSCSSNDDIGSNIIAIKFFLWIKVKKVGWWMILSYLLANILFGILKSSILCKVLRYSMVWQWQLLNYIVWSIFHCKYPFQAEMIIHCRTKGCFELYLYQPAIHYARHVTFVKPEHNQLFISSWRGLLEQNNALDITA